MTTLAPETRTSPQAWRERVPPFVREHRKVLGVSVTVFVLILLILIDHSGPAATVQQASGPAVAQGNALTVTTTGDTRVSAKPGSAHAGLDGAGLSAVRVTLTSSAGVPLVVDASGRLLGTENGLVVGFVSGGVTVPAHGSAVLQLSGVPPFGSVAGLQLDLHATAPPAG